MIPREHFERAQAWKSFSFTSITQRRFAITKKILELKIQFDERARIWRQFPALSCLDAGHLYFSNNDAFSVQKTSRPYRQIELLSGPVKCAVNKQ